MHVSIHLFPDPPKMRNDVAHLSFQFSACELRSEPISWKNDNACFILFLLGVPGSPQPRPSSVLMLTLKVRPMILNNLRWGSSRPTISTCTLRLPSPGRSLLWHYMIKQWSTRDLKTIVLGWVLEAPWRFPWPRGPGPSGTEPAMLLFVPAECVLVVLM